MKLLVYGIGVIGSLTIHELCKTEHEITVVARGNRKEAIEKKGLCIKMGKKTYTDYPRVISEYDNAYYDITFCIMQNQQQEQMIDILANIQTKALVLVGNNMTGESLEQKLTQKGVHTPNLFFAFQTSAGQRYDTYTEVASFGKPSMQIGHLHREPDAEEKDLFKTIFHGSSMQLEFMDDMDSWYKCHIAFILPIVDLAYAHNCNLRTCTWNDMKNYMKAGTEVYDLYQSLGIQIRPKGDEKNTHGIRAWIYTVSMWIMGKGKLGELAITNHCKNAVREMQFMEEQLERIRTKNPKIPMPTYEMLKNSKPDWETLQEIYNC